MVTELGKVEISTHGPGGFSMIYELFILKSLTKQFEPVCTESCT